jgi:DEAD/DEAH box helicase domain-containing protein
MTSSVEDHIVIDVEIQRRIEDLPNGWDDTDKMGVACAVVYEYLTDRFRIYGPNDVDALKSRLRKADRISGYNIWRFDFPVIFGVPKRELVEEMRPKTNDLLLRIYRSMRLDTERFTSAHKGWSLDNVCKATLGLGKIASGEQAPKWFQEGEHARVINYCVDDVTLERDLTTFIDKYGFVCNSIYLQNPLRIAPEWRP